MKEIQHHLYVYRIFLAESLFSKHTIGECSKLGWHPSEQTMPRFCYSQPCPKTHLQSTKLPYFPNEDHLNLRKPPKTKHTPRENVLIQIHDDST